jgi:hypothetical protein
MLPETMFTTFNFICNLGMAAIIRVFVGYNENAVL